MDLKYLHRQMNEELHGAEDYAQKAFEIRPMDEKWADTLIGMARTELNHADNMYLFFMELYDKTTNDCEEGMIPAYLKDCHDEVTRLYYRERPIVEALVGMY